MTFLPALIGLALLAGSVLAVATLATVGMVAMARLEQATVTAASGPRRR